MQVAEVVALTVVEYFPAGHDVQVVCPAGEYVPAGQLIGKAAGSGHLCPAGHIIGARAPIVFV